MVKSIFIGIPSYKGQFPTQTMLSLLLAFEEAREQGWGLPVDNVFVRNGDANVASARNILVAKFLSTNCTDFCLFDDDIAFGRGAFSQLVGHGAEFVGGAYRKRTDDVINYPIAWTNPRNMQVDNVSGLPLVEAVGFPAGMWRLHRSVLQRMTDHAGADNFFYDEAMPGVKIPWVFHFDTWPKRGQLRSEDLTFCAEWRELGGRVWVDPTLCVDHIGSKVYKGDIGTAMREEFEVAKASQLLSFGNDTLGLAKLVLQESVR